MTIVAFYDDDHVFVGLVPNNHVSLFLKYIICLCVNTTLMVHNNAVTHFTFLKKKKEIAAPVMWTLNLTML